MSPSNNVRIILDKGALRAVTVDDEAVPLEPADPDAEALRFADGELGLLSAGPFAFNDVSFRNPE